MILGPGKCFGEYIINVAGKIGKKYLSSLDILKVTSKSEDKWTEELFSATKHFLKCSISQAVLETVARVKPKKNETKEEK